MRISDLHYDLPEALIAAQPASQREAARLMVVHLPNTKAGSKPGGPQQADAGDIEDAAKHPLADVTVEHRGIRDLPALLGEGDLLVMNDTRVLPARFDAVRAETGGWVEGLFLETHDDQHWRVMLKSGGRLRVGDVLHLIERRSRLAGAHSAATSPPDRETSADTQPTKTAWSLTLQAWDEQQGTWWCARKGGAGLDTQAVLERIGAMPLPPYIRRQREQRGEQLAGLDELDRQRYQTVYAREPGAVAAPTAGLHLTEPLLNRLRAQGVSEAFLTLHVGLGTFQPVRTEMLEDHEMHRERYAVPGETLAQLHATRGRGGRIIAVGTTSVRALESLPDPLPIDTSGLLGETDLKIMPGFNFRFCDGLLTNFHLPGSTLMALVGARLSPPDHPQLGIARLKALYERAIAERYRFYSYGDAMLILGGGGAR